MTLRTTHTSALLEVSAATHAEIRGKLEAAEYHHAFDGEVIDMHGIALTPAAADPISEAFAALAATESAQKSATQLALARVRTMAFEYRVAQGRHMPDDWAKHFRDLEDLAAAALGQEPKRYLYEEIIAARKAEPLYVLIKDHTYYRPNSSGYTSDLLHAGLYTEAESLSRLDAGSGTFLYPAVTRELATDALAKLAERKRKGFDSVDPRMLELFEEAMGRGSARLARFKDLVHERLDEAHVPHDPDPEATAQTGSRITSRLAWVFSRELNGALLNELEEYHDHTIDQGDHDCEGIPGDCPVARLLARARGES